MNIKEFNNIAELVKKLADQGKFKRGESEWESGYEYAEFIAELGGEKYIIEENLLVPSLMEYYSYPASSSYKLTVKGEGGEAELDDEDFEEIEKLHRYVKKRVNASDINATKKKFKKQKMNKAFEVIGKPIIIEFTQELEKRIKLGIFQESYLYATTAEGDKRPALDFIHPIYDPSPKVEEFAKGKIPRERIDPRNPILSIHYGVDHLKLDYCGLIELPRGMRPRKAHEFRGELGYVFGSFCNDGNVEEFNRYREALQKAWFPVW